MPDMLVRLYELPDYTELVKGLERQGVSIRRVLAPEMHVVIEWVGRVFGQGWASECHKAMANTPITCFVAVEQGKGPRGDQDKSAAKPKLIGFACYDATIRGFFGPTGVAEKHRGRGIGKALLWACLNDMKSAYGYAVIGGVGPAEFYAKAVGAEVIARSDLGVYRGMVGPQMAE